MNKYMHNNSLRTVPNNINNIIIISQTFVVIRNENNTFVLTSLNSSRYFLQSYLPTQWQMTTESHNKTLQKLEIGRHPQLEDEAVLVPTGCHTFLIITYMDFKNSFFATNSFSSFSFYVTLFVNTNNIVNTRFHSIEI